MATCLLPNRALEALTLTLPGIRFDTTKALVVFSRPQRLGPWKRPDSWAPSASDRLLAVQGLLSGQHGVPASDDLPVDAAFLAQLLTGNPAQSSVGHTSDSKALSGGEQCVSSRAMASTMPGEQRMATERGRDDKVMLACGKAGGKVTTVERKYPIWGLDPGTGNSYVMRDDQQDTESSARLRAPPS